MAVEKRSGGLRKAVIVLFALLVLVALVRLAGPDPSPEERAKDAQSKAEGDKRVAAAMVAKRSIIAAARNPDSVKFDLIGVTDDASLVCIEYRAENGFGGMNREQVAFQAGASHRDARFWNANCRQPLNNLTRV
jgi:hypothetical protein